jgi:Protein of unknown function (DUF1360)
VTAKRSFAELVSAYSDEPIPLRGYFALAATFNLAFAAGLATKRGDMPERVALRDVVLLGVATHKFSRLLAKDRVTSFLRAPFVRYKDDDAGPGEVNEVARGQGIQRAVGELVVCPYCIGLWVASAFTFGLIFDPRPTRFVASVGAALTIADALQLAYASAVDKA